MTEWQGSSAKAGYVGLIGLPNAGKSSLVNALVGEKVSIVTSKPQTTRQRVTGILSLNDLQAIFVDAPGYVKAQSGLNKFLHDEYLSVVEESDALLLLLHVDANSPESFHDLIAMAKSSNKPCLGIITKVDRPEQHRIFVLKGLLDDAGMSSIQASATKRPQELREKVLEWLKEALPSSSQPLFDPDLYTTQNLRQLAAEVVREKCFEYLHQEIPFGLAVNIVKYDESNPTLTKIHAEIWVNRESHQGMVIGKGGISLKRIGSSARQELESIAGTKVFLDLFVKVKKNWVKDDKIMKELGYVVP